MALADFAAWMVIVGQIGPVALSVTTSLHIDFLRKPDLVDVVAEATLLKLGRRLGVAEVALVLGGPRRDGGQGPGHLLDPPSLELGPAVWRVIALPGRPWKHHRTAFQGGNRACMTSSFEEERSSTGPAHRPGSPTSP